MNGNNPKESKEKDEGKNGNRGKKGFLLEKHRKGYCYTNNLIAIQRIISKLKI